MWNPPPFWVQNHESCFRPYLGVFHPIWVLGVCVGGGGGSPNGVVCNLLMRLFALYSSKTEVSATYFFDIRATHNDQPSYIKHVWGSP